MSKFADVAPTTALVAASPLATGTPAAQFEITPDLVEGLLRRQHPDLANLDIRPAASGWDNMMFRLGDTMAVRLPRRAIAAPLILHEQQWLPVLAPTLPLPIPAPIRIGRPDESYPWSWSVLPWLVGEPADLAPPKPDQGPALGEFFAALHRPAPDDAPHNPYRGVPLSERRDIHETRMARLAEATDVITPAITEIWTAALATPEGERRTWLQGDPHGKNVLTDQGRFSAVIDWGDLCAGDPASDLAAIWMLLPEAATRAAAIEAYGGLDEPLFHRAQGWAVIFGVMLLEAGLIDDPRLAQMGSATLHRLEVGATKGRL